ncbi:acyltransferase [Companilactobacillus insicii]|uniref:acyltransferase n=1 Tax=Companilactobacillus insicii TaxID=1732567 RepID=UPI000F7A9EC9|nr:acyltransferase [Companilactobacillus insicii]
MRRKRIIYIDIIRVVAMLAVVFAHTCANILIAGPSSSRTWAPANMLVTVTEIAVPLFYMISGATILNSSKTTDIKYLFKHRLVRVGVPFIIWAIISAVYFQTINEGFNLGAIVNKVALLYHQPVVTAFWFLYPLLGFYLVSPAIKAFIDKASDSVINYILILWYITNIFLPGLVSSLPPESGIYFTAYGSVFTFLSRMAGYFILGYKLSNVDKEKINLKLHLNTFIIGMLLAIANMYVISKYSLQQKPLASLLTAALLPFLASSAFLILKKFEDKYPMRIQSSVETIAPLTYGIYLTHGIVIDLVQHVINPLNYLAVFPVAILVCIVFVWALSNIPFINHYFI